MSATTASSAPLNEENPWKVEREVADRNGLGGPRRAAQSTPMVTFGIKR
jgi:hypothetical protein